MLRYEHVSGVLFTLIAIAQFFRALRGLPAQVGTVQIPVWWSWLTNSACCALIAARRC